MLEDEIEGTFEIECTVVEVCSSTIKIEQKSCQIAEFNKNIIHFFSQLQSVFKLLLNHLRDLQIPIFILLIKVNY